VTFLAALPGRIRQRVLLDLDAGLWRRATASLRSAPTPAPRSHVMVCCLATMIAGAKTEALISGVMRLKGSSASVLLPRPDRAIERLFRATGPDVRFIYFDHYLSRINSGAAHRQAEELLANVSPDHDLSLIEHDGIRTGRNALSTVLRSLRIGHLDMNNTDHRARTIAALATSFRAARAAQTLLAELRPDHVLFNERGYTPAGEVFDACITRGIDAIQWLGAPKSDSLVFKRYTRDNRKEHPLAISDLAWDRLRAMLWPDEMDQRVLADIRANYATGAWFNRQQLQEGKSILAVDEARAQLGLSGDRKVAVIFAHILYDATFFYGDSLYPDYETWLVETVRQAVANPNLDWIVKVHPVNVWRSRMDGARMEQLEVAAIEKAIGPLPPHVRIMPADTSINTYTLFDLADYGLTVRGTIGMELPCFGIPVVTAGTGRYSGRGFTMDPPDIATYNSILGTLHTRPRLSSAEVTLARRHFHAALSRRPMPMTSFVLDFSAGTFGEKALAANTFLKARAPDTLLDSPDLGAITDWILDRHDTELFGQPA
jgi:hypothetical protein